MVSIFNSINFFAKSSEMLMFEMLMFVVTEFPNDF